MISRLPLYLARFTELQGCAEGQLDYEIALRDQRAEQTLALVPRRAKVIVNSVLTSRKNCLQLCKWVKKAWKG